MAAADPGVSGQFHFYPLQGYTVVNGLYRRPSRGTPGSRSCVHKGCCCFASSVYRCFCKTCPGDTTSHIYSYLLLPLSTEASSSSSGDRKCPSSRRLNGRHSLAYVWVAASYPFAASLPSPTHRSASLALLFDERYVYASILPPSAPTARTNPRGLRKASR
jgi:hypothetical protein